MKEVGEERKKNNDWKTGLIEFTGSGTRDLKDMVPIDDLLQIPVGVAGVGDRTEIQRHG